jgi:hypothetical protein
LIVGAQGPEAGRARRTEPQVELARRPWSALDEAKGQRRIVRRWPLNLSALSYLRDFN